jgi:hypothetical protein
MTNPARILSLSKALLVSFVTGAFQDLKGMTCGGHLLLSSARRRTACAQPAGITVANSAVWVSEAIRVGAVRGY